jgi:hypothetical protein
VLNRTYSTADNRETFHSLLFPSKNGRISWVGWPQWSLQPPPIAQTFTEMVRSTQGSDVLFPGDEDDAAYHTDYQGEAKIGDEGKGDGHVLGDTVGGENEDE